MNEDAYGYANALQNSISAHQEAIQSASEDLMKNANNLPNKIKEVGIGIGSKILGDAAGKLVGNVVGGVQKALSQGVTKASQAATKVVQTATNKVLQQTGLDEEAGDAGDADNAITANEQNPLFDPDADVEEPAFEEAPVETPEYTPNLAQPPTAESIQAAGELEEGDAPEEASSLFDNVANVAEQVGEEGANIGTDLGTTALTTATDLGTTALTTATDLGTSALTTATDLGTSAINAVGSGIASASQAVSDVGTAVAGAATGVGEDVAATGLATAGVALDATGIGSVVGVLLGIGGILASIFAPSSDDEPTLPPPPNFSYQAGA